MSYQGVFENSAYLKPLYLLTLLGFVGLCFGKQGQSQKQSNSGRNSGKMKAKTEIVLPLA